MIILKRERRLQEEEHIGGMYASNVEPTPPSIMASRKKQKTAHVSQSTLPPPPVKSSLPSPTLAPVGPGKRGPPPGGARGKKGKGV